MDTELLKTFLEVKKTRHFGKAAENLHLTQAAVSSRIKQLETYLGTPLFTRYRNNLQLTAMGERLIHHAELILIAWNRAKADVVLKKNQKKILAIGSTSGLWELIFQDALNRIHQNMPEIALRAESQEPDVIIRRLMERTLDLGLVYESAKIPELISIPVAQTELALVTTDKGKKINEVLNEDYVLVDWGASFHITHAKFFKNIEPPVLHTTLAKIALKFILHHGGSAYLPLRLIDHLLGDRLYRVESSPVIIRPIFACYHAENINMKSITRVIEIISAIDES